MSDPWTSIASIIGGGGALTLLAGILVYVTREAIAKAVTQAGQREIERLKGDLAKGLEDHRHASARELERWKSELAKELESQKHAFLRDVEREKQSFSRELEHEKLSFSRELEREKQESAKVLEQFKAGLTLQAEVRRHAAAKKVEVLLNMASVVTTVVERMYTVLPDETFERNAALNEYWGALRAGLALLGGETIREMTSFGNELVRARTAWLMSEHGPLPVDFAKVLSDGETARDRLLEVIRCELQLGPTSPEEAS